MSAAAAWGGVLIAAIALTALLTAVQSLRRARRSEEAKPLLGGSATRDGRDSGLDVQQALVKTALLSTIALLVAVTCARCALGAGDTLDAAALLFSVSASARD